MDSVHGERWSIDLSRTFIERFTPENIPRVLSSALRWINVSSFINADTRVFIKPNLTWKVHRPGITVTPQFIRAFVEALLPLTSRIVIGESEGGQACFKAEEAFENHGLYSLEKDYGIRVVNLSTGKHERAKTTVGGESVTVELPSLLLHETDVFITLPVPKIHAMTGVSLGFKNQWGCLGDNMRVRQHPYFDATVLAINKLLQPKLCIFDGTYFLDYTGPMMGEAVPMNLVIAGDDIGAASLACCEIMRVDPLSIAHHRLARAEGMFPASWHGIESNRNPNEFSERRFRLRRAPLNYIHLMAFKFVLLNRLFYASKFADSLHEFLWFIRQNALIKRFLYGRHGTGEANRGGRVV
jgi:uncharacterized protein (DUF362 family)